MSGSRRAPAPATSYVIATLPATTLLLGDRFLFGRFFLACLLLCWRLFSWLLLFCWSFFLGRCFFGRRFLGSGLTSPSAATSRSGWSGCRGLRCRARTILHDARFFFLFFFLVKILFQRFAVGAAVAVFVHFVIPAPEGPIIEAHISSCEFDGHRAVCAGAQENKTTLSRIYTRSRNGARL